LELPETKKIKLESEKAIKLEKMEVDNHKNKNEIECLIENSGSLIQYLYIGDNRCEINGSEDIIEISLPFEHEETKEQQILKFKYINDNRNSRECHQFIKSKLTDDHVITIANHCPNLKHINLSQCQRVTDESLEVLISKCQKLEHVTLAGCNVSCFYYIGFNLI